MSYYKLYKDPIMNQFKMNKFPRRWVFFAPIAPFPNKTKASVLMYHLFRLVANALTEAENHREEAFPWLWKSNFSLERTMVGNWGAVIFHTTLPETNSSTPLKIRPPGQQTGNPARWLRFKKNTPGSLT